MKAKSESLIVISKSLLEDRINELQKQFDDTINELTDYEKNNKGITMQAFVNGRFVALLTELHNLKSQSTPLTSILEIVFESGREYGDTWARFHNTDGVSRHEAESTETFEQFLTNTEFEIK